LSGGPIARGIDHGMPVLEAISFSSVGKIIATVWASGSRLLWSVAVASAAAAVVLRVGAYFNIPKAQPFWEEYGLILTLLAVVVAVLAAFKMRAERRNTGVALVADEQQSRWHQTKQPNGEMITQFTFQFYATNMNDGAIHLSNVRLNWPWVKRSRILMAHLATEHPQQSLYSSKFPVQAHARRACSANIMVSGAVGGLGRKKPMRVTIGVQDHAGRWHKLVFRGLHDPTTKR
jgi:hypothetical protein